MPPVFGKENICSNVFNPTPNMVVGFFYRQVPRKPRLACPVKCEAYLTRVSGEHHFKE